MKVCWIKFCLLCSFMLPLMICPRPAYSQQRDCVVEITSAEIERSEERNILRLQWRLKEIANWQAISRGALAEPKVKLVEENDDPLKFDISFSDGEKTTPLGSTSSLDFRSRLRDFDLSRNDRYMVSVSFDPAGRFNDISEPFSERFDRDPPLGTAEITARSDTTYSHRRQAVRRAWSVFIGSVSGGEFIAWLLLIILIWGGISIYLHMKGIYTDEMDEISSVENRISAAEGAESIRDILDNCSVLNCVRVGTKIDQYRDRIGENPGRGVADIRDGQELDRLRNTLRAGMLNRLDELVKVSGNYRGLPLSLEIIRSLGVIAPMIGLLGTVLGISGSFGGLYFKIKTIIGDGNKSVMENLSEGIHLALNTTIFGLIVGIVFFAFYYIIYFRKARIESSINSIIDNSIKSIIEDDYVGN